MLVMLPDWGKGKNRMFLVRDGAQWRGSEGVRVRPMSLLRRSASSRSKADTRAGRCRRAYRVDRGAGRTAAPPS